MSGFISIATIHPPATIVAPALNVIESYSAGMILINSLMSMVVNEVNVTKIITAKNKGTVILAVRLNPLNPYATNTVINMPEIVAHQPKSSFPFNAYSKVLGQTPFCTPNQPSELIAIANLIMAEPIRPKLHHLDKMLVGSLSRHPIRPNPRPKNSRIKLPKSVANIAPAKMSLHGLMYHPV
ncbi:hypothetical protein [Arsenophonus endosymbiont of Bemisia tabaci]|uniref:hypothetical protein n=1 Tax=Arsenophonus endosymbiont of Bemisia tabaci TaxID=536059 RepID=UPI0015F3FCC4|nr:hypothetical protein [Arsenophonus endosymbiont of Bemisia tabaci]CAA2929384.1 hypothetical protein ARSQ2_00469 [Arsenophonus endosymbiont of Bemisia tabaci Q2]